MSPDRSSSSYQIQIVHVQGRRGRPAFSIASSQLEYLHSLGFTRTEMAGESRMTLYDLTIDGYSRLVVYLKRSTNNLASTVYGSFIDATRRYGVPSRVRSRENTCWSIHA